MGGRRRIDPEVHQVLPHGTARGDRASTPPAAPARSDAESRVVTLRDGARWLVTVVARLVSEDAAPDAASPRLVVRLEPHRRSPRAARVATVRARSLHAVDDEELRRLVTTFPARRRRAVTIRMPGGG